MKPGKLLPLDTGGKLRTYNILRHLSADHDITYLTYYDGCRDTSYEREIVKHFPGTVAVHSGVSKVRGVTRFFDYVRRLRSAAPYAVSRFASAPVRRMLSEWLEQPRFDIAICDFLASAQNFPPELSTPTVLFQHNVETVLWKRRADFASTWINRIVSNIESARMARYEAAQVGRFHRVIAVSEQDRQAMSQMTDPARISVIPTGVDLARYTCTRGLELSNPQVVFTGSMDWEPNIDGVEYFCHEIWPHVLSRVPLARFRIVGRDPDSRVRKLASASIDVTGTVPSIIEHLREAMVLVVPLRMGGGTRIKIYEGMAMGKATVSTTVGAEGLDVHHEQDILLADDPRMFAECVVRLLQDRTFRKQLEAAAAATARQYDWSVVTQRFVEQLQAAIASVTPGKAASPGLVTA